MGIHDKRSFERKAYDGGDTLDMPAELKKMQTDITSALDQLGKSVDSKNDATVRKVTDWIQRYDDLATKWTTEKKSLEEANKAAEAKAEEATKRVQDLEHKMATGGIGHNGGPSMFEDGSPNPNAAERQLPEFKAFCDFIQSRPNTPNLFEARNILEKKDAGTMLRTDNLTQGGYLVPPVTDHIIRKKVVELSPIRSFATTRSMTSKSMSIPVRKALLDSYFEGETDAATESESRYGEETVTAWRHAVKVKMTYDQLVMSPFNMEAEISADVGQSFAKKEGYMFLKGTGNKQPSGLLVHPEITKYTTKTSATVSFDDVANLIGSMKAGYNPMLMFNRATFSQLIQLKDAYGRPLWTPVAGDKPATIWDEPYSKSFIDMDSMVSGTYASGVTTGNGTSGTIPIIYADLREAYEIFDLIGMSVIRDDVTQADKSIIIYNFRRWLTAKTIMPEAVKPMWVQ